MTEVTIKDDFDLDKIADSGQCFRWEKREDRSFRILQKDQALIIKRTGEDRYLLSCDREEYESIWLPYFDLGENYRCIRERISPKKDAFLARACDYGRGIRILRQDPWEMIVSFIISQNKNIPAIQKSIGLLCEAAGAKRTDPEGIGYYAFPSAEEILTLSDEALSGCKLGYRTRYVKAAAEDVVAGKLAPEDLAGLSEEEALSVLTSVCGIGVKVANCVSLFGLHHIDAFPVDVWIDRILKNEYPGGYPMENYHPYNGIYQQYMFYFYRNIKARNGQKGE